MQLKSKSWPVFKAASRSNIDMQRTTRAQQTIFQYDATKIGAADYTALALEVAELVGMEIPSDSVEAEAANQ